MIRSLTLVLLSIGCLLFSLFPAPLPAQEYVVSAREFRTTEGLSNDQVLSLLEDREGFIWIGTKYGLNRFDGHNFRVYTKDADGLQSNIVDQLLEGPAGNVWAIRFEEDRGKYKYYSIDLVDPDRERVQSLTAVYPDLPFTLEELERIYSVSEGILFQLADGKYHLLDGRACRPLPFPRDFGFIGAAGEDIFFGKLGDGYGTLNLKGERTMFVRLPEELIVAHMASDYRGNLWCLAGERMPGNGGLQITRLLKIDESGRVTERDQLDHSNRDILFTGFRNGRSLLYLVGGDIREYDLVSGKVLVNRGVLKNRKVINPAFVLGDRNEGLWLGDYLGLRILSLEASRFTTYLKDQDNRVSARGMVVLDNDLIYTYPAGPHAINLNTGENRRISEGESIMVFPTPFSVRRLPNDHLIFGGKQMIETDGEGRVLRTSDLSALGTKRVWSFTRDGEGQYWLGFGRGEVVVMDGNLEAYRMVPENGFTDFSLGTKWHFLEDSDHLWAATQNGLFLIEKDKGVVAQFGANAAEDYYLPAVIFHHIHQDQRGDYWLATGDGGLIQLSYDPRAPSKPDYRQYRKVDGLPSLELYAVLEDAEGFLWISTANGLVQFEPTSKSMVVYYEEQGVADNEFNRLSHYQHTDGRIFLGGLNGITAFSPAEFDQAEEYQVPLRLSAASLFSSEQDGVRSVRNDFIRKGALTMYPTDNFLNLEFALQDYFYSDLVRYSYRIPGIREEWTALEGNNLQLVGLPYGAHSLEVRARGRMNRLSSLPLQIELIVVRPFYLRWWFLLLVGFTLLVSVWQYTSRRKYALLRRQETLEKMVAERTRTIREDKKLIEEQAAQLRELDELKSQFFENVSHELRTPLTLILGPLERVLKRNRLENQDFTLLHLMRDNAKKLHKRINELLDLSSIDAMRMSLEPEPIVLYPYVKSILAQFEGSARLRSINLSFEFALDHELRILADPDKVEKIIYNLLSNAIKFTPEGGQVSVRCERQGEQLILRVRDTGIGIPERDLSGIFDRFQRVSTEEHYEGTGIGLALCKELSELMEGTISVDSVMGEGSTFTLSIPLVETFAAAPQPVAEEVTPAIGELSAETADISGEPILVVEDNPSLREYLRLILEDFHVRTAAHGRQAMDILEEGFTPALIVTDIMMPVMDGMELLREIRSRPDWRTLPVIMLTAKAGSTEKINALRVGVDDYLTKPFAEDELNARVHALIENSRARLGERANGAGHQSATEPSNKPVSRADLKWLEEVEAIIMARVGDPTFGIDQLADQLNMSTRRVQQKIKAITGMTPKKYQREIQLERARRLLESGEFRSVAEVSYQIGFSDAHYFSKLYEKRFGKRPSEY
ncbi:ATP-binding protein [Lewinella sp. W8]|uniref:ATP-binding protein n=1 Tax=Lewinella sp. W8 TaxID=2528208 RepID=UPI0015630FA5